MSISNHEWSRGNQSKYQLFDQSTYTTYMVPKQDNILALDSILSYSSNRPFRSCPYRSYLFLTSHMRYYSTIHMWKTFYLLLSPVLLWETVNNFVSVATVCNIVLHNIQCFEPALVTNQRSFYIVYIYSIHSSESQRAHTDHVTVFIA